MAIFARSNIWISVLCGSRFFSIFLYGVFWKTWPRVHRYDMVQTTLLFSNTIRTGCPTFFHDLLRFKATKCIVLETTVENLWMSLSIMLSRYLENYMFYSTIQLSFFRATRSILDLPLRLASGAFFLGTCVQSCKPIWHNCRMPCQICRPAHVVAAVGPKRFFK